MTFRIKKFIPKKVLRPEIEKNEKNENNENNENNELKESVTNNKYKRHIRGSQTACMRIKQTGKNSHCDYF